MKKIKSFIGVVRESLKNYWTQEFVMESFSEKAFEAAQQCNDMKRYQQSTRFFYKQLVYKQLYSIL